MLFTYLGGGNFEMCDTTATTPEMQVKDKIPVDRWVHRAKSMRCYTCMYWVRKEPEIFKRLITDVEAIGRCRRHSPFVNAGWPVVYGGDWCGDHKLDGDKV